jgi:hypothetical protein
MTTDIRGAEAASLLFEKGLWFDAVVRGLVEELGLTTEDATRAALASAAERFSAHPHGD